MAPDKHVELLQRAVGRLNEVLMREFGDLSPADHAFVCYHTAYVLHLSFRQHAIAVVEAAKKPRIIVPEGPTDVG